MKKIITVFLGGIIISLTITNNATAQNADKGLAFAAIKNNPALISYVNENNVADSPSTEESLKSAEKNLKASKANFKALKATNRASENFKKLFKNSPDASWSFGKDAIVARFHNDEVKTTVIYSKKGSWIHTLCYYPAHQTPENVRTVIQTAFPDDDITLAVQVKEGDLEFYIVNLESKTMYKRVSVYNGETNVISENKKSIIAD